MNKLKNSSDKLGEEPIIPLLLRLSIPAIIGMAIQALYNVVDSIYIGHLSTEALSALTLAFPIQMILIAISVGTGTGANSLISRVLGKNNRCRANNIAEHVVIIAVIYGILVGIVGFFFANDLISIFSNDPQLIDMGTRYIRIIMVGSIALFIPIIFNNILRGEGNTFIPMVGMLIGAIINMILDPFLIFGIGIFPKLGVEGAAYATVIARLISGIFITKIILNGKNEVTLRLKEFDFDFDIFKELYQVGFPAMLMMFLSSIMIAGMNVIVSEYGTTAIAVVGIYFRLQSFVFMPVFGLTQGFIPIVGYNYGHNNPDRMKKTIIFGMLIGFAFTLAGFALFQIFPNLLIRMFNGDQRLLDIGTIALKRISLAFPVIGLSIVGATTFQALGKGMPSLTLSLLRQIVFLLPSMYFLGKFKGLDFIWFAFPIAEGLSFIILVFWLFITLKKSICEMKYKNK
ncbi:MAG: MATE family efflux transporter [Fusobacteriota bacterium]